MNAQPLPSSPLPEAAHCQAHPERPALGVCTRCGTFFCREDYRFVEDKPYCATCAARPDVDYLEDFRLQYWGKRDAWAWLVGLGALFNLAMGLYVASLAVDAGWKLLLFTAFFFVAAGVGVGFWWGKPWARLAFMGLLVVSLCAGALTEGPEVLGGGVVPLVIAIGIFNDTRNKLFFKQEVSPEALKKAWHLYKNNTVARTGLMLGMLGLLVPGAGLLAIGCSIVGLRRVNPNAHPPIGRKGHAIAGLVLGVVGTAVWGLFISGLSGNFHD